MIRLNLTAAFIAVLALAGCMTTTAEAPVPSYAGVEPVMYTTNGINYRIYDKPQQKILFVEIVGQRWSASKTSTGSVTKEYFAEKGQNCTLRPASLVEGGGLEYRYTCVAAPAAKRPLRYCTNEAQCRDYEKRGFRVDREFVGVSSSKYAHRQWAFEVLDNTRQGTAFLHFRKIPSYTITDFEFEAVIERHFAKTGRSCTFEKVADFGEDGRKYSYSC
ncbi:MAG: hypothetical protein ACU0BK_06925 [Shimia sp.]|uniref:hypothetical protein n=1 Tax=Shimia sp. TaxID=1954381 RepID=UPI0040596740